MTKASIVQKLLDAGHITAEEAVVLLRPDTQYTPYQPGITRYQDWGPYWTTTSTPPPSWANEPFEYPDTKWPGDKNS